MSENQNQIQWYPGHMAKAKKEISESIKLVDVVIEMIDARIPKTSRNPVLNEIIGNKPRIIVMNKADLADAEKTKKWQKEFEANNQIAIVCDSNQGKGIDKVSESAISLMHDKIEKASEKGRTGVSVKVMIVGIPNVGKSTLINKIAKKPTAEVGNKPGVTKKNQWICLNDRLQLLDTPGVLWPKFDDQTTARHLAYVGTIKDDIMDIETIAFHLIEELLQNYQKNLWERYKIDENFSYEETIEVMDEIGRKRGCLVKGGEIDYTKVASIILDDFRTGKIGRITLE